MAAPPAPRFRLLGDLRVAGSGIPGSKQRLLLAYLLLHAGETVATDRLVDAVWGARPPRTANAMVHSYVGKLREALSGGSARLVTHAPGYVLELNDDVVDVRLFEQAVAEGRGSLAAGDASGGRAALVEALSLWRGNALADLEDRDWVESERGALEHLRLEAIADRIAAHLELGAGAELVPELETLVRDHPYDERFRRHLMLALYRSGRQHEALRVYRDTYRLLTSELGLEPGPELQALERSVLQQDPALTAPSRRRQKPFSRRRTIVATVALLAIAGGVAGGVLASQGSKAAPPAPRVAANSLVELDPATGQILSVIRVGDTPVSIAATRDALWVVNRGDRTVSRVDLKTHAVRTIGGVPFAYDLLPDNRGNVWVSSLPERVVTRITAGTTQGFPASPRPPETVPLPRPAGAIAVGGGYLWVTDSGWVNGAKGGTVTLIDLATHRVAASIPVGEQPRAIAFGYGSAWVGEFASNGSTGVLAVIRPGSSLVERRVVDPGVPVGPRAIRIGLGSVWILSFHDYVIRVDPDTRRISGRIHLPSSVGSISIAVGGGAVWVTERSAFSVGEIDPRTNRVVRTIPLGNLDAVPCGIATTPGAVWVTIGPDTNCGSSETQ